MDKIGNILIPARFEQCYGFNEGMAAVDVNGKWGFIDIKGELTIPAQYTCVVPFSEGLAAVEIDDKWGAIDQAGNLVIPAGFDDAFFFDKGLAFVEQEDNIYSGWFFIDKQGRRHFTEAEGREFLAQEAMQATTPRSGGKAETVQAVPDAGYADRVVDVDSVIPQAKGANFGTYAVVIANENYRSFADVGNAANDGNVLHQYLTKTLGIPENNIIYCENASAAMMDEALSRSLGESFQCNLLLFGPRRAGRRDLRRLSAAGGRLPQEPEAVRLLARRTVPPPRLAGGAMRHRAPRCLLLRRGAHRRDAGRCERGGA